MHVSARQAGAAGTGRPHTASDTAVRRHDVVADAIDAPLADERQPLSSDPDSSPMQRLSEVEPPFDSSDDRATARRRAAPPATTAPQRKAVGALPHRRLGDGGPMVSRIAYGNSLTAGVQCTDDTAKACVRTAFEVGVTTFDTADVYADGRAEEILGTALRQFRRDDVVLCTKVGRRTGLSGGEIRRGIDDSLRRLGVDHVDVYQAHRFDDRVAVEETMAAFADVVRAGKARWIGVSGWSAEQLSTGATVAARLGVPLVASQPQYSMLCRDIEADLLPTGRRLGIGQLVWSPLAGGVLTGKYRPGVAAPPDSRHTATEHGAMALRRFGFLTDDVLAAVRDLAPIAADAGLSMAQLAVAWVLATDGVVAAIIGASRPEQIRHNVRAVDAVLSAGLLADIDRVLSPVLNR